MRSDRGIQFVCVVLAVALVLGSSMFQPAINDHRATFLTGFHDDLAQNLPPKVAFAVTSMGAFRGLAIDYLWITAVKHRQAGRHFQSLQLARWICDLQPRFPSVWQFQAWEMAYNISVTTHTPEERWTWVYDGVKLLRDRGIPLNPTSLPLYKELAWIFFHKMGDILDDMHWAYKAEWAVMMQRVLGEPDPNATTEQAIDAIRRLAEAPERLETLSENDPRVGEYVAMVRDAGIELGYPLLARADAAADSRPGFKSLRLNGQPSDDTSNGTGGLPGDDEWSEPRDKLVAWVRADILRREFKLDPAWMAQLMEKFGPLDWRATYTHALYWSTFGDHRARRVALLDDIDALNNDRLVHFSLSKLIRLGRVILDVNPENPNRSYVSFAPDLRFIEPCHRTYIELGARATGGEGLDPDKQEQSEYFRTGHANFLHEAITLLYMYGGADGRGRAQKYYRYLQQNFRRPDGSPNPSYLQPLEEFALGDFKETIGRFQEAHAQININLTGALLALADGDMDRYRGSMSLAQRIHAYYMEDKRDDPTERRKMPPFKNMLFDAMVHVLELAPSRLSSDRPPRGVPETSPVFQSFLTTQAQHALIMKSRIWQRLEAAASADNLRKQAYDRVLPSIREECSLAGFDLARVFPEPPGMDEYRREHGDTREGIQANNPDAAVQQ